MRLFDEDSVLTVSCLIIISQLGVKARSSLIYPTMSRSSFIACSNAFFNLVLLPDNDQTHTLLEFSRMH